MQNLKNQEDFIWFDPGYQIIIDILNRLESLQNRLISNCYFSERK